MFRTTSFALRPYRAGDETRLIALWQETFAGLVGYVERSATYWRWCILERPGVTAEDILIVEHRTQPVAYGVLGPGGQILEFVVQRKMRRGKRARVARELLDALEERARRRGHAAVEVQLPATDGTLARVLRRRGYLARHRDWLQWVIVDLAGLIERVLAHRAANLPSAWRRVFVLELESGHYRCVPYRCLRIETAPVRVQRDPSEASEAIQVKTDMSTLADLLFNRLSWRRAAAEKRIHVWPPGARADVRRLLRALRVTRPWYTPLADHR